MKSYSHRDGNPQFSLFGKRSKAGDLGFRHRFPLAIDQATGPPFRMESENVMTTLRTPIHRPLVSRISPRAMTTFRKMLRLEARCRCKVDAAERCKPCQKSFELDAVIGRELKLSPWQFPAIAHPSEPSPYSAASGTTGALNWPAAQARYHALAEAAGIGIGEA